MEKKDQHTVTDMLAVDMIMQAPIAIGYLKGPDLIIDVANSGMLELWGGNNIIIGKPLKHALGSVSKLPCVDTALEVYHSGYIRYGYETPFKLNRNGYDNLFYFDWVYKPLKTANGTVTGVMVVATEVTKQVVARSLLADTEERLRLAIEATGIGTWDLDMLTNEVIASPRLSAIFGIEPDGKINQYHLRDMIHPEDKALVNLAYKKAGETGLYIYEARIVWTDGSVHWIRTTGKILFDADHKPVRMLGTTNDISGRKQEEIMKNDFIAMASHELKTPLTSLKAFIQLLVIKAKKAGDEFFINALEKSENQINKMTRLIHGFLDLTKIESGRLQLNLQRFDINTLIADVVADSLPHAAGHSLVTNCGEPVTLLADKEKIGEVLSNLISNAIKYSPRDTTVSIATQPGETGVRISVTDQGWGIKLQDQQHIFQRFYRVENENNHGLSGFGIGLYLSTEIIRLHHGSIGVNSEEGKGSEFYFILPVQK